MALPALRPPTGRRGLDHRRFTAQAGGALGRLRRHRKLVLFPFARLEDQPTASDPITTVDVDRDLGKEGFAYVLASGRAATSRTFSSTTTSRSPPRPAPIPADARSTDADCCHAAGQPRDHPPTRHLPTATPSAPEPEPPEVSGPDAPAAPGAGLRCPARRASEERVASRQRFLRRSMPRYRAVCSAAPAVRAR